jgi:hypothetical protein
MRFEEELFNGNKRTESVLYLNLIDKSFEALFKTVNVDTDMVVTTEKSVVTGKWRGVNRTKYCVVLELRGNLKCTHTFDWWSSQEPSSEKPLENDYSFVIIELKHNYYPITAQGCNTFHQESVLKLKNNNFSVMKLLYECPIPGEKNQLWTIFKERQFYDILVVNT